MIIERKTDEGWIVYQTFDPKHTGMHQALEIFQRLVINRNGSWRLTIVGQPTPTTQDFHKIIQNQH